MGGFIDVLRRAQATILPVCAAWAITANRLERSGFEKLANRFADELQAAKADALLLAMHGHRLLKARTTWKANFLPGRARSWGRIGPLW